LNPIEESEKLINKAWDLFQEIPLGRGYLERLSALKVRLHQPCELAIAGKVKAGKSSFLNALIGENLAKVGDLETTATINRFCYGKPEDPDRPVKVVWDDGAFTLETLDFMNSLQGHDTDTLAKASKIAYLEYQVENPLLRELTLVDTPGTGAVVEAHQNVAERYFDLREKHKRQTHDCTSKADAVVYLMGAVANINDKSFLDDFKSSTEDCIPINAIGVLSKVDIDMNLLENRHEQSQYLADSLKEQLCTVVPVSAGLHEVLKEKSHLFPQWQNQVKSIKKRSFSMMLKGRDIFMSDRFSDIHIESRKEMLGNIPWSIFRTIANSLYYADTVEESLKELNEIANIDNVKHIVKDYFFSRSKTIRCTRIMNELYQLVLKVHSFGLFQLREENCQFEQWIQFVQQFNDPAVTGLVEYLQKRHRNRDDIKRIEIGLIYDLKSPIEMLLVEIKQTDDDFQALQLLRNNKDLFKDYEFEELNTVFGPYQVIDKATAQERLDFWQGREFLIRNAIKQHIVHQAINKYNQIIKNKL